MKLLHSEHSAFLQRAKVKARDDEHRFKIMTAVNASEAASATMKAQQFRDWQQARQQAAQVKDFALAHLPDFLEEFERKISARGARVLWAEDAAEARRLFMEIAERHATRKVVKSKSMVTEEVGLNEALEAAGIDVLESDLGELIVQLAQEKPYHIISPAIHKTKAEIAALFHEKLGVPLTDSAEELTAIARRHLRDFYLTADLGVTGANFLLADHGAIVMTENEGNGRLSMSCPPVHVVFCGIEKVLPRLSDLALFLPLLSTSGTGQQLTSYNSIVRGPRQAGEVDGPEYMYVILLDNGRTKLYANERVRHSLRCIRCGACFIVCPIWRTVGGHTYNTPYQGPIGSVIMPHLQTNENFQHLSFASSLCGACSESCPVNIDLHHLLLQNREEFVTQSKFGWGWKLAIKLWAVIMSDHRRLRRIRPLLRLGSKMMRPLLPAAKRQRAPALAHKSFREMWEKHEHS